MARIGTAVLIAGLVGSAVVPTVVNAQESGDIFAGREIAAAECTECHIIGEDALGGNLLLGAPTFMEVADDPAVTELSLRVFLQSPHQLMPNFVFSETEADAIIAYILSLRP